jgi:hypothetical protein
MLHRGDRRSKTTCAHSGKPNNPFLLHCNKEQRCCHLCTVVAPESARKVKRVDVPGAVPVLLKHHYDASELLVFDT